MKFSARSIFSVFVILAFQLQVFAATGPSLNPDAAKTFEGIYARSHTLNELLENLKNNIPSPDYEYIHGILKNAKDTRLPAVKFVNGQMVVSLDGVTVSLKAVAGKALQFELNNHVLDFEKVIAPEARYKMCEAAMPKSSEKSALFNLFFPAAHAQWIQAGTGIFVVLSYLGSLYFGNDNQCKDIGLAIDQCRRQKKKIEVYVNKMKNAYAVYQKKQDADKKTKEKSKKKKSKAKEKDSADDDPDEDLQNWITFKTKMEKDGICPITAPDEDLDDATATMFSEVLRGTQITQSWMAHCSKAALDRVDRCIEDVGEYAKKLCLHISVDALEGIHNDTHRTEVALPIDPMSPSDSSK